MPPPGASTNLASSVQEDADKRNNQIADLVSDIRHLQLDLEYHQQKLDQMIEEKREMMAQMREKDRELGVVKASLEERDQELQHKELDLQKSYAGSRSQSPAVRGSQGPGAGPGPVPDDTTA